MPEVMRLLKSNFYMGVDAGGYDGNTFAICVMSASGYIKYCKSCHNKDLHNKEVERLAKYYDIPEWAILKEQNTKP